MMMPTVSTRILVCEDSETYARGLITFLEHQGAIEVVGVCTTGEDAVQSLSRLTPDLVTVDLELPGTGGLRTIETMMQAHPVPIVVLSSRSGRRSEHAAAALAAGALDALDKARLRFDEPNGPPAIALRHRLRRLARVPVGHQRGESVVSSRLALRLGPAEAVGICSSTGGPRALQIILAGLPRDFPLPVLVAQHMSPGFMDGLVRWLDQLVALPVAIAQPGMNGPGVWIAPDDADLSLAPSMQLSLDRTAPIGPYRPSGDVLLRSMAEVLGARALGVVLTGMGRDGADGAAAIIRAGGGVIAQDAETSAVFGMPKAAIEQGARLVLPLGSIAGALRRVALGAARA